MQRSEVHWVRPSAVVSRRSFIQVKGYEWNCSDSYPTYQCGPPTTSNTWIACVGVSEWQHKWQLGVPYFPTSWLQSQICSIYKSKHICLAISTARLTWYLRTKLRSFCLTFSPALQILYSEFSWQIRCCALKQIVIWHLLAQLHQD